MKCRDCENLGWSYDEGERIYWCYVKRVYCPDLDIERSCSDFSLKKPDIFTTLSTIQAENENLRAELEQVTAERDAAVRQVARSSQPNEPLTLEQLRQMDGRPVWIVEPPDWGHWELSADAEDYIADRDQDLYGLKHDDPAGQCGLHVLGWLAYRRPPEGENHHG